MKAETKISERRACILVGIDRLTFRYRPQIRDAEGVRNQDQGAETDGKPPNAVGIKTWGGSQSTISRQGV